MFYNPILLQPTLTKQFPETVLHVPWCYHLYCLCKPHVSYVCAILAFVGLKNAVPQVYVPLMFKLMSVLLIRNCNCLLFSVLLVVVTPSKDTAQN